MENEERSEAWMSLRTCPPKPILNVLTVGKEVIRLRTAERKGCVYPWQTLRVQ